MDLYLKEFEKLNEYQKNAITSTDKYILLNAAVGSGKTTVLAFRVLYLHYALQVPLKDMVVLTFTKRATLEMINRITFFGEHLIEDMKYFGTFHGVARLILSESPIIESLGYESDFKVIDNDEASKMLLEIIENDKLKIKYRAKLIKRVDEFKNGKPLYGIMKKNDDIDVLVRLYNEEKVKRNVMDFDDIIENCNNILNKPLNPCPKYIIVDEFQDTDYKQFDLIKRIAGDNTNIFCIGDPNQIIYSWRSGNLNENIFNKFKKEFSPKEMGLPLNYRSTRTIIEAANSFLYGTVIQGTKDYGSLIKVLKHHDAFNEACYITEAIKKFHSEGVLYKDMAVLFRRKVQLDGLLNVLCRSEIPCNFAYQKSLMDEELENPGVNDDGVNLLTLHASKGLEFSHVFIIGANMGNIPMSGRISDEPEELRLFYVGITRAKEHLEISYVAKPEIHGVLSYKSPYLSMIPSKLLNTEEEGSGSSGSSSSSLHELIDMIKADREKNLRPQLVVSNVGVVAEIKIRVQHSKYGIGTVIYEDDDIIRASFESYGEKEFSKVFCPLEFII